MAAKTKTITVQVDERLAAEIEGTTVHNWHPTPSGLSVVPPDPLRVLPGDPERVLPGDPQGVYRQPPQGYYPQGVRGYYRETPGG